MKRWIAAFVMMLITPVGAETLPMVDEAPAASPDEPARAANDVSPEERGALIEASELMQRGDLPAAGKILSSLLERYPHNRSARQLWLAMLVQTDRYNETRAAFESLYDESKDDFTFLNNYAWFLATAKDQSFRDPVRAVELARAALLLAPNVYNIWSTLAEAYYVSGDFARAKNAMQQAIEAASQMQADAAVIENYRSEFRKMAEADAVMTLME